MWTRATATGVFALALLLAGCDAPGPPDRLDAEALPRLVLEEELRIGSRDDPDRGFSRPTGLDVDRDGRLYVYDALDRQIRVYGPAGTLLHDIGRPGEGPGEFQHLARFGVEGDTVWTVDLGQDRITLFDREGALLSTGRASGLQIPVPGRIAYVLPWTMRPDGFFTSRVARVGSDPEEEGEDPSEVRVPRLLFDVSGAVVDTIGQDPGLPPRMVPPPGYGEGRFQVIVIGSGRYRVPDPPTELPIWAYPPDGLVALESPLPTTGEDGVFTVTKLDLQGDTLFSRDYHYRPSVWSASELEAIARRAAEARAEPDDVEAVTRRLLDAMTFPEFRLPVQSLEVTDDGSILLLRNDDEDASRWLLLDSEGLPRGWIDRSTERRILRLRGDTVWMAEPDEVGVPWLVRYRIAEG